MNFNIEELRKRYLENAEIWDGKISTENHLSRDRGKLIKILDKQTWKVLDYHNENFNDDAKSSVYEITINGAHNAARKILNFPSSKE